PPWVAALNEEAIPTKRLGSKWTCGLSAQTIKERTTVPRVLGAHIPPGFGLAFPHTVGAEPTVANYAAFTYTPDANEFVFETAQRAVAAESLGKDDVPDVLTINLSSNDYIGHGFGPYSAQAVDMMVRTDAQLASFLAFLDKSVGAGKYLFVLTSDHGVSPIPEDAGAPEMGVHAGRFSVKEVVGQVHAALTARFGPPAGGSWFALAEGDAPTGSPVQGGTFLDGMMYFSPAAVRAVLAADRKLSRRDLEQTACDAINGSGIPGVYGCYGRTQILEGRTADTTLHRHLAMGVHPQLSADLIVLQEQLCLHDPLVEPHAAAHGTPYAYDTHVPVVLYQPGLIKAGVFGGRVTPMDIAPTVSLLVGVEFPSGCDGDPLTPALAR
ncbi:MAG TPA: alkaline phosphatase family protein, partial [Phycisphaerales bacterium]|nr:alkaline phosphatase family protein [Phycisphaerales bacterium]